MFCCFLFRLRLMRIVEEKKYLPWIIPSNLNLRKRIKISHFFNINLKLRVAQMCMRYDILYVISHEEKGAFTNFTIGKSNVDISNGHIIKLFLNVLNVFWIMFLIWSIVINHSYSCYTSIYTRVTIHVLYFSYPPLEFASKRVFAKWKNINRKD